MTNKDIKRIISIGTQRVSKSSRISSVEREKKKRERGRERGKRQEKERDILRNEKDKR